MDEIRTSRNNLVDTTDCLEAITVLRGWKNLIFTLLLLGLLILQVAFWMVTTGAVTPERPLQLAAGANGDNTQPQVVDANTADPNAPHAAPTAQETTAEQAEDDGGPLPVSIDFDQLAMTLRIVDGIMIIAATIYCLSIMFSLKISIMGRMGGINHICRAFFLSLVFLILLIPWQHLFVRIGLGAMFTAEELARWGPVDTDNVRHLVMYFLRFPGFWLLVFLLLISTQIRTARWTNSILRRLEVI